MARKYPCSKDTGNYSDSMRVTDAKKSYFYQKLAILLLMLYYKCHCLIINVMFDTLMGQTSRSKDVRIMSMLMSSNFKE